MKINHKIEIDLFHFFKLGKFDYIKIGQTKEWILNNFPNPDEYIDGKDYESSTIWRYGNIEFYFSENKLDQIYSDYIQDLSGGEKLNLKKWIFEKPKQLTLEFVINTLLKERINFNTINFKNHLSQISVLLTTSNIYLNFQPNDLPENESIPLTPNDFTLQAFLIK